MKRAICTGLAVLALFVIAGCAHQPAPTAYDPPGFFTGLWHGFIIIPSVVVGLFTEIRIYAFPNTGYWYDVGYVIGALFGLGPTIATIASQ
jgi:hypothetical protein